MTDAKPDPLEALRVLASPQAYTETPSPFQAHTQQVCAAAIAAWKKERAAWKCASVGGTPNFCGCEAAYIDLRAAAEKVRDELREAAGNVIRRDNLNALPSMVRQAADALDAALRGGE